MLRLHNSASIGTKSHARTPVVLLLPHDLKRLVHSVRALIERQHSDGAKQIDRDSSTEERGWQSRLNDSGEN